jgi:hypothetical protein
MDAYHGPMRTAGWCPVHDKVYRARDGRCPECGTPLVAVAKQEPAVGPIRPQADVEPDVEPDVDGSTPEAGSSPSQPQMMRFGAGALAAIVTGIILILFLAGLAIPRDRARRAVAPNTPPTRADVAVNVTRIGAGVRLRLESFTQRGATVVLRVGVPSDPRIDTGLIQGVTVAFSDHNVEIARVPMPTRASAEGFIAAVGVPDLAHAHITSVRITAMTVGLGAPGSASGGILGVDLNGVWPVKPGSAPRIKRVGTSMKLDDGRTVRLDALVGWPDHIEARLEVRGQAFNWDYDETYGLAFDGFGGATGKVDAQAPGGATRYIDFVEIDHPTRHAGLQINVTDFTVNGDWTWKLA